MSAALPQPLARSLAIGRHRLPLPRTRTMRATVGALLIIGGLIPFLPPGPGGVALGFAIISVDYPGMRRVRRRAVILFGRPLKRLLAKFKKPALAL